MKINHTLKVLKTNIIRWYNFKENAKILLFGDDVDELYDFLSPNYNVVKINSETNYITNKKFDYIIIKNQVSLLESLKNNLYENGTILLLLNNRWGVTYFAGSDGFKTLLGNKSNLLNKDEIERFLKQFGFDNYKFFYPLPNYDFVNVIYSDVYLPDYTDSKLANNNIYLEDNNLVFDEIELLKNFTRNGDFTKFTNSYLVEINPKSEEKAIFFNNNRKDEYRLITKIFEDRVEKETYNVSSQSHLNNIKNNIEDLEKHSFNVLDKFESNKVISKFVKFPNLYQEIIKKIKSNELDSAVSTIEKIYNDIKEKFSCDRVFEINQEYFKNLNPSDFVVVKKAYIDLVLENMFLENQSIYIYDQEWCIENCPLEFILFRIINNIYMMNSEIEKILPREEMLRKFGFIKNLDNFYNAENIFQSKVINEEMLKIYERAKSLEITEQELSTAKDSYNKLELYKSENLKKENYIKELQEKISKLSLYEAENVKKEKYILELQSQIAQLQAKIDNIKK